MSFVGSRIATGISLQFFIDQVADGVFVEVISRDVGMHGDSFSDEVGLDVDGLWGRDRFILVFGHGELGLGRACWGRLRVS